VKNVEAVFLYFSIQRDKKNLKVSRIPLGCATLKTQKFNNEMSAFCDRWNKYFRVAVTWSREALRVLSVTTINSRSLVNLKTAFAGNYRKSTSVVRQILQFNLSSSMWRTLRRCSYTFSLKRKKKILKVSRIPLGCATLKTQKFDNKMSAFFFFF